MKIDLKKKSNLAWSEFKKKSNTKCLEIELDYR